MYENRQRQDIFPKITHRSRDTHTHTQKLVLYKKNVFKIQVVYNSQAHLHSAHIIQLKILCKIPSRIGHLRRYTHLILSFFSFFVYFAFHLMMVLFIVVLLPFYTFVIYFRFSRFFFTLVYCRTYTLHQEERFTVN